MKTSLSDLSSIQGLLDRSCNSKFKANSKYKKIVEGGAGIENAFSRVVSSQVSFLQKQLNSKSEYYENLNNFLLKNVNVKINFIFNHGLRMLNLIHRVLELLNLDRLFFILDLYKKYIFPIYANKTRGLQLILWYQLFS